MKFVLDASVALAWFLPDEDPESVKYAARVLDHVENEIAYAVVPLVWHAEVAGKLLRRLRSGRLTEEVFERAARYYQRMPLETHMNAYTVEIIIERARRYHLQGLDAQYFDLAAVLSLPLATLDGGLRTAAKSHGVKLFAPPA